MTQEESTGPLCSACWPRGQQLWCVTLEESAPLARLVHLWSHWAFLFDFGYVSTGQLGVGLFWLICVSSGFYMVPGVIILIPVALEFQVWQGQVTLQTTDSRIIVVLVKQAQLLSSGQVDRVHDHLESILYQRSGILPVGEMWGSSMQNIMYLLQRWSTNKCDSFWMLLEWNLGCHSFKKMGHTFFGGKQLLSPVT